MPASSVAFVHDRIAGAFTGSEKVYFKALELYPDAKLYTLLLDRSILPAPYRDLPFETSFLQHWPMALKRYKAYFPIMPLAIESLNLQEHDLIFSSSHCVAKGVIPRPDAYHACYCHSPARYIWDLYWEYVDPKTHSPLTTALGTLIGSHLRTWDVTSAARVDLFLANSRYTAQRIERFYRRQSMVLHPPVHTQPFRNEGTDDYYLMVGRIVGYKGFELAVDAFNASGKPLVIIGKGPDAERLRAKAKANIRFLGPVDDATLIDHMNRCKGFLFPGREDFGIVMAEAQAAGKPVLAYAEGGALDIVRPQETGLLFDEQTTTALNHAVQEADQRAWDAAAIRQHALQFDEAEFLTKLQRVLQERVVL